MDESQKEKGKYYLGLACQALYEGDIEYAIDLYVRSIDACPSAEAHTYLGWAYSLMGKLEEAIGECKKAIALDPEYGNPYNDVGAYLIEIGKYEDAVPYLEKALRAKRYDNLHYPHFNLGRVFAQRGMLLKAAEEFREALKIEPSFRLAADSLLEITEQIH